MYIWNIFKTLIFLLFCSRKFVFSEPEDVEEREDLRGVELDICERVSNYFYTYKRWDKLETYTPHQGYGFSVVKARNNENNAEKIFWQADDLSELATEVKLTKFWFVGMFRLTIKQLNGTVRVFMKERSMDWTEVDPNKIIPVYVLIKPITDSFAYSTYVDEIHGVFTANKGFAFNGVLDEDGRTVIWKTENPKEYANKVIIDGTLVIQDTLNVTVISDNGFIKHFVPFGKIWVEVFPAITLNISIKESTFDYRYLRENNIEYFIANGTLGFKGVQYFGSHRFNTLNFDIWKAQSKRDYAKKAIVVSNKKKEKFLVLFLIRGGFLLFYRSPYSKKWADHTNIYNTINNLRLAGFDITHLQPAKTVPGPGPDHTKFLPRFRMYLSTHDHKPIHMPYFPPKPPQPPGKPSKPPELPVAKPRFPIKPCSLLDMGPRNLIILDIAKMDNLFGYEIAYRFNKVIFTAKPLFLFRQVKFHDTVLWDYKGLDYPYKVVYSEINGQSNVKVFFNDQLKTCLGPQPKFHRHFDASEIQVEVMKYKKAP